MLSDPWFYALSLIYAIAIAAAITLGVMLWEDRKHDD